MEYSFSMGGDGNLHRYKDEEYDGLATDGEFELFCMLEDTDKLLDAAIECIEGSGVDFHQAIEPFLTD